jgi:hypothetical protein
MSMSMAPLAAPPPPPPPPPPPQPMMDQTAIEGINIKHSPKLHPLVSI